MRSARAPSRSLGLQAGSSLLACWLSLAGACSRVDAPGEVQAAAVAPASARAADSPLVLRLTEPSTPDWPQIEARGVLRVLVVPDRTDFFIAAGQVRGFEYELLGELEQALRARAAAGSRPQLDVAFVPVSFEQLLASLVAGHGDVAAASLTVTDERRRLVDFTQPYLQEVAQIVVAGPDAPPLSSLEDLAGSTVCVAAGTSYADSLARLNRELTDQGLAAVRVETPGRGLETEDMLELVHAGAFPYTVTDRHLAELWAQVLPRLRLHPELSLDEGGRIAWAVRKSSPELKGVLDGFVVEHRKGTLIGNVLFERYYEDARWVRDPAPDLESGRLGPILAPLQALSERYGFDWLAIVAQAYQESRLDPSARSSAGAVGLMQLLPSTARDMGFEDISDPEDNLHAGIKYLAWLRDTYFDDPDLPPEVRLDFALAAYNAGPARVRRWRLEAPDRGVDPDRWFGQVENLAREDVGLQPVQYVGNINKYYVIFSRLLEDQLARSAQRRAAEGGIDVPTGR